MPTPLLLAAVLAPLCGVPGHADGDGAIERGGARPILTGAPMSVDSDDGLFRVHWTHGGADALAGGTADFDEDGLPDDIDRVLDGLAQGVDSFAALGYRAALPDLGLGGSTAIDVYVGDIDANGYAHPIDSAEQAPASSCFMELNAGLGDDGSGILESVAVHELHHCVQYAYTPNSHSWIYEATATFEQYRDRRSGPLDAALEFLWVFRLANHDRPVDALGDRFEYAGLIFLQFWEELDATASPPRDARRVPDLWEALAVEPRWPQALDTEAQRVFDQGFDRTFLDFATWNLFACSRSDGLHYDAVAFPCTLPNTSVRVEEVVDGEPFDVVHDAVRFTATFHEAQASGDPRPPELICEGPGEDAEARVRLVAIDALGRGGEEATATARDDEGLTLRLSASIDPQGSVAVVAASTGGAPIDLSCRLARVEVEPEGEGCACRTGGSAERDLGAAWVLLGGLAGRRRRRAARRSG